MAAERRDNVRRSESSSPLDALTLEQLQAMTLDEKIAHDFGNDALERYKAMTLGEQNTQMREWIRQINDWRA